MHHCSCRSPSTSLFVGTVRHGLSVVLACVAIVHGRCAVGQVRVWVLCASPSPWLPFIVVVLLVMQETFLFVLYFVGACYCGLHFCNRILDRVGLGQPNTYRPKNRKRRYYAIFAIPPWRRHTQPATPLLFGGVFSKFLDAIPPWLLLNNTAWCLKLMNT